MEGKDNPVEKVVIEEEEPDGIEIDDVLNLQNLLRTVFIDQKCQNLKVIVDRGEFPRNIKKNEPDVLKANVHSVDYAIGESVSSTRM